LNNKEHLTLEGLHKIMAIRGSLNLGLSIELITKFPFPRFPRLRCSKAREAGEDHLTTSGLEKIKEIIEGMNKKQNKTKKRK
jgi:hypothetical protein